MASCLAAGAFAIEVKVIANPNVKVDSISINELRSLFLEEKISLADGTHVEPVFEKSGPVHEKFVQDYLGRSTQDLQMYYRSLTYAGQNSMPKQLGSDAEVVDYVSRKKGAIGYVDAQTGTEGVKVLRVVQGENGASRRLITRVEPVYPDTLKPLGITGVVRLQITISAHGSVENVELLGGNPILAEAAMAAVKQWTYSASHARSVTEVSIPFAPPH